jgi:hypothetical protein
VPEAELVTVIIPNWNGERFIGDCLGALAAQTVGRPEIIVIDNGSRDGSNKIIKENFAYTQLIELGENEGFARAVNRGIRASKTEFIALLNNDAVPDPDWLERLLDAARENPGADSFACKIVFHENSGVIDSAGDLYAPWGMPFNRGHDEPDDGRFSELGPVFGPCAAAALYRKSFFSGIGLFNENFFAYYEDTDLSLRALLAGKKCLYVPAARVRHHYSASSSGKTSKLGKEEVYIHLTGVLIKNMPAALIAKHFISIAAVHSAILFFWFVARARRKNRLPRVPLIHFLSAMINQRKNIQKNRKISAKELSSFFCYKNFVQYIFSSKRA